MLWFFAWFVTQFGNLRSYFQSTADAIGGVPYVGPSLASPFAWIASFCGNLQTASEYMGEWANTLYDDAAQIFGDIRSSIMSTWPVLAASASWFFGQVRDQIASYWSILSMSASSVVSWISSALRSAFPVLTASASWFFGQVRDQIASYWSILSMNAAQFASWVWPTVQSWVSGLIPSMTAIWSDITSGRIQAWVGTWWTGQSTAVLGFVTGAWGYLITSAFDWLDKNWSSAEASLAWFAGKMIKMLTDKAASFSGALWGLLEAVLRNIDTSR